MTPATARWTALAAVAAVLLVLGVALGFSWRSLSDGAGAQKPVPFPAPTEASPLNPSDAPTAEPLGEATLSYLGLAADGGVEAGGFAQGPEEGALCTLVLRQGSDERRADGEGSADATTIQCGALAVARDQLASGVWTAQLIIVTPSRLLESAPTTIEVP